MQATLDSVGATGKKSAWKDLAAHYKKLRGTRLRQLFEEDPERGERYTLDATGLLLDYSKNLVTDETLELLFRLAAESNLQDHIEAIFRGEKINFTENRAVLHTALRFPRAGVAINPATPASVLEEVLPLVDLVLVMTVDPGFGHQHFLQTTLPKIERVRKMIDRANLRCELEVDGGVDESTAPLAASSGADVFVAGSSVFGHQGGDHRGDGPAESRDSLSGSAAVRGRLL